VHFDGGGGGGGGVCVCVCVLASTQYLLTYLLHGAESFLRS